MYTLMSYLNNDKCFIQYPLYSVYFQTNYITSREVKYFLKEN